MPPIPGCPSVWQEAVEREIDTGEHDLAALVAGPHTVAFAFPRRQECEPARSRRRGSRHDRPRTGADRRLRGAVGRTCRGGTLQGDCEGLQHHAVRACERDESRRGPAAGARLDARDPRRARRRVRLGDRSTRALARRSRPDVAISEPGPSWSASRASGTPCSRRRSSSTTILRSPRRARGTCSTPPRSTRSSPSAS